MNTWISPTHGPLSLEDVFKKINQFIRVDTFSQYEISVGCDSQNHKSKKLTKFSVAIAVHRVGMGGIYFYRTFDKKIIPSIKQRLFEEASYGIEVALEILDFIEKNKIDISLEFHLDVNVNAKTESNKVANEIINYVHACGIEKVYPKPAGVTASSIADRHSK